jgi:uncharacterized coiled-coil DUF342 family protein
MLPRAEIKRHDPEVENKYNKFGARLQELRDELSEVDGEIEKILVNLGELVASGKSYKKQTARLAELRAKSEALELGCRTVRLDY